MKGAVVFDLDDTLYLERDYVRSGFQALDPLVRERTGLPAFAARAWALFEEGVRRTIFDAVFERAGQAPPPGLIPELVERYRSHAPDIRLLPDALGCLDALGAGGYALAGVTDGPRVCQRAKAQALKVLERLAPLVFTDELGPGAGKPALPAFREVEARTGFGGASCVYVADNPHKDFQGPRALGWRTVRVRRAGGLHAEVEAPGCADVELPDLTGLAAFLEARP